MARKDLLKGLMDAPARPGPALSTLDPSRPRYGKGAIGAVSRSIADLKARALIDIDPALIDAGGAYDRLESDPAEDAALARSIAEYGQQVPVLVRPNPEAEGRFQIVYGRRRVLAMRDLGLPVRALVRDLDDRELLLAQGQENTARRDLSFIEKANFARQMTDASYDRKIICDALSIDKTVISRMLAVTEHVPLAVIEAIGAAPSVGRDRWLALTDLAATAELAANDEIGLGHLITVMMLDAGGGNSDARFEAVFRHLSRARKRIRGPDRSRPEALKTDDFHNLGQVQRTKSTLILRLKRRTTKGFENWIVDNISGIYRQWLASKPGNGGK